MSGQDIYLGMVIAGYAVFMVALFWGWAATRGS